MKVSLSQLCKIIGTDRLAARRFLERRGILPDKEGKVDLEHAKEILRNTCENSKDADARIKSENLLQKLSGNLQGDWVGALGLTEQDPTIEDAAIEDKDNDNSENETLTGDSDSPKINNMNINTHLGMRALTSPFTAMVFTTFALLGQAYLFGHLAHRTFETIGIPAPMWFHFIMALIFECTGILIAASFNDNKVGGSEGVSARGLWLFTFFTVQVISDLCLFGVIKNPTIGTVIVALAMPIALLGYANLYMEENRNAA